MIKEFVDAFIGSKSTLRAQFKVAPPEDYKALVESVARLIHLNPEGVRELFYEDYQGEALYILRENSWAGKYWYVKVDYGSCSGCDTLEGIRDYSDAPPTEEQLDQFMSLALHIVQGLKAMP